MTSSANPQAPEPERVKRFERWARLKEQAKASFQANDYDWDLFLRFMLFGLLFLWRTLIAIFIVFVEKHPPLSFLATFLVGGILSFLWLPLAVSSSNNASKRLKSKEDSKSSRKLKLPLRRKQGQANVKD